MLQVEDLIYQMSSMSSNMIFRQGLSILTAIVLVELLVQVQKVLLPNEDEGIMAPRKAYLESVGAAVPDKLGRHPSAASPVGRSIIHN